MGREGWMGCFRASRKSATSLKHQGKGKKKEDGPASAEGRRESSKRGG